VQPIEQVGEGLPIQEGFPKRYQFFEGQSRNPFLRRTQIAKASASLLSNLHPFFLANLSQAIAVQSRMLAAVD